jgi:hypothetical protein
LHLNPGFLYFSFFPCLSNACLTHCWLVYCLSLFISLALCFFPSPFFFLYLLCFLSPLTLLLQIPSFLLLMARQY